MSGGTALSKLSLDNMNLLDWTVSNKLSLKDSQLFQDICTIIHQQG